MSRTHRERWRHFQINNKETVLTAWDICYLIWQLVPQMLHHTSPNVWCIADWSQGHGNPVPMLGSTEPQTNWKCNGEGKLTKCTLLELLTGSGAFIITGLASKPRWVRLPAMRCTSIPEFEHNIHTFTKKYSFIKQFNSTSSSEIGLLLYNSSCIFGAYWGFSMYPSYWIPFCTQTLGSQLPSTPISHTFMRASTLERLHLNGVAKHSRSFSTSD